MAKRKGEGPARAREIVERLAKAYPDWGPTLDFTTPFELLVATILAAQSTDENVNRVTKDLFRKYRGPKDFSRAPMAELERDVFQTGFFRQKARALRRVSEELLARFSGEVPRDMEGLTSLFGVGRKTASVVLGAAFRVPSIAVDTHAARVAGRLGLTGEEKDREKIEADLRAAIAEKDWIRATWCLILHGRRTCTARRPRCPSCAVRDLCPYPEKTP
jgi:endonuclease-3